MRMSSSPTPPATDVVIIGTYPPRRCGIATFSRDLRDAVHRQGLGVEVAALDDPVRPFPSEVTMQIRPSVPGAYRVAADRVDGSGVRAVLLQHEFGIHGGPDGEDVLDFVRAVRVPVVSTLHTILEAPSQRQRSIIDELCAGSDRVVVMSLSAARRLRRRYSVDSSRIVVIPHGVPDVPAADPRLAKRLLRRSPDQPLILSFGLLGQGKGYELAIEAIREVLPSVPDARYVILGATHPNERQVAGESYRQRLGKHAETLGLGSRIELVDEYVDQPTLIRWLQATDVYLTPYPGAEQIVSGTLAYAVGAGRAIVSTPFTYAREVLADGRGTLVPSGDSSAMAAAIVRYLVDGGHAATTRRRAYDYGRAMRWSAVGKQYADVIDRVARRRSHALAGWSVAPSTQLLPLGDG